MLAYVDLIQKKEKAIGCDVFTHQKWSGASYSDRVLNGTSFLRTNRYLAATALSRVLTDRSLTKHSCVGWLFRNGGRRQRFDRAFVLSRYRRLVERVYKSSCEQSVCMCEDEDEEFLLQ